LSIAASARADEPANDYSRMPQMSMKRISHGSAKLFDHRSRRGGGIEVSKARIGSWRCRTTQNVRVRDTTTTILPTGLKSKIYNILKG
jgi:hypothetical protein